MVKFGVIDTLVLVVYFVGSIMVGFYFHRRSDSSEGFTSGNHSLPGWLCGMSIFATYLSSLTFIGIPAMAFSKSNWSFFSFTLSLPFAIFIAQKYFLPYYRRSTSISAYAALEDRFGVWASVYASACFLSTQIARMGAVMYLTALPMSMLLGWDMRLIIIVTGLSVIIYSFAGGILAVIWTDTLQGFILIAGALACMLTMLFTLPEGPLQVFSCGIANGKFSLGGFVPYLGSPNFWVIIFFGLFINLQNFGIDQCIVQRYKTASSDREARKGLLLGGLLYIPISAVFFFIGTLLFVYYQSGAGVLPPEYVSKPDYVFPYYIINTLPIGLKGLLIAAIFAAAMSTVSSCLNSSATLLMNDYFKRFVRRNANDRQCMTVLYLGTVAWGILGTVVALLMIKCESGFELWQMLAGILGGGMLGLFLLGIMSKKVGNSSALPGAVLGVLVIMWMTISPKYPEIFGIFVCHMHAFLIPVVGTLTILFTALSINKLMPGSGRKLNLKNKFLRWQER